MLLFSTMMLTGAFLPGGGFIFRCPGIKTGMTGAAEEVRRRAQLFQLPLPGRHGRSFVPAAIQNPYGEFAEPFRRSGSIDDPLT